MEKLMQLRKAMTAHALAGYIQPVHDEYMSEYPPACNRRVEWLCGFSGSAGSAAVLRDKAALFTDGRYTLQAQNETDAALYEQHNTASMLPESWLAVQAHSGDKIGYDAKLYTRTMLARMKTVLGKKGIELVAVENLVDGIWLDRPAAPATPLFMHELRYAGVESSAKRRRIGEQVALAGADAALLTAPDAVNWLLNIRGRDVENTPLALGVAIIEASARVHFYIMPSRCDEAVRAHLGDEVMLCEPSALEEGLLSLGKYRVLCDPQAVPVWFTQTLEKAGAKIVEAQDPCMLAKAVKNPVELKGIRSAHIRDGAAVVKLLCWMEGKSVTEIEVSEKLLYFRAQHPMFVEPSFTTIAGSGPHGAIVHYRVTPQSDRAAKEGELFLLDSGGQYPDGTTDITRTFPIGAPTQEHKECFTRVLKGHIALATAFFPHGTSGSQLDALARQYLWQAGLDYDHGTGHGVGCFLGVHEGPQRISKRGGDAPLKPGMIVSNEPGYYKAGEFGIRIENLVAVVEKNPSPSPLEGGGDYLGFDTVTCVPIDTRLVEISMLTAQEKQWLNAYHAWVLEQLADMLDTQEQAWLKARCAAI